MTLGGVLLYSLHWDPIKTPRYIGKPKPGAIPTRPDLSGTYALELGTASGGGDAARLWIDGKAIVDGFERGQTTSDWEEAEEGLAGGGRGYVNLTAGALHEIRIEYR